MSALSSRRTVAAALLTLATLAAPGLGPTARSDEAPPLRLVAADCAPGAPPAPASAEANRILDRLGVARVPISYVFVVDTSRSMQDSGRYGQVLDAMPRFVAALNPGDQVGIVTFDADARLARQLEPRGDGNGVLKDMPAAATGENTDIGRGLEVAVAELGDAPAGAPAAVILLSDGEHLPAPGSRFPTEENGGAWPDLTGQAQKFSAGRPFNAYAVPLDNASGVDALCTVLPGATLLPVSDSTDALASYLQRAHTDTRLKAAATLLRDDRDKGVQARWTFPEGLDLDRQGATATLRLENTAPHLPVVVDAPRVMAQGELGAVGADLPPSIELGPREAKDIDVPLTWTLPDRSSYFGTRRDPYASMLTLGGTVSSPLAAELAALKVADLDVAVRPGIIGGNGELVGEGTVRWDPSLALVLSLIVLVLGVLVLTHRAFPPVTGQLNLRHSRDPAKSDDERTVQPPFSVRSRPHAYQRLLVGRRVVHDYPAVDAADRDSAVRVVVRGRARPIRGRRGPRWLTVTLNFPDKDRSATAKVPIGGKRLILGVEVEHRAGR